MLKDCDEFERTLLEVVFNDLEPLESIAVKLSQQPTTGSGSLDTRNLQRLLLVLIANDLVGSYMIHAESPYVTAVETTSETIHRYWYRITSRGRRRLHDLRGKHGRIHLEQSA